LSSATPSPCGGDVDSLTGYRSGLTAITGNLIGKFEYRYYNLGKVPSAPDVAGGVTVRLMVGGQRTTITAAIHA
jgi:hypothetical protein